MTLVPPCGKGVDMLCCLQCKLRSSYGALDFQHSLMQHEGNPLVTPLQLLKIAASSARTTGRYSDQLPHQHLRQCCPNTPPLTCSSGSSLG